MGEKRGPCFQQSRAPPLHKSWSEPPEKGVGRPASIVGQAYVAAAKGKQGLTQLLPSLENLTLCVLMDPVLASDVVQQLQQPHK